MFIEALYNALNNISQIKRARVGRRIRLGRLYDDLNIQEFPFVAILEFANEAALRQYLDHPAHEALAQQFYSAAESALAFDFELMEPLRVKELLSPAE